MNPTGVIANVLRYFAHHRTAANLILVIVIALGLASFPQLRSQFFPDIVYESVRISVNWDGAGASDIDNAVIQPMIPELQNIEGVIETQTSAFEGRATINLEFDEGWDMQRGVSDAKTAIDNLLPDLPDDVEVNQVSQSSWADRVTNVVIAGPVDVKQLARLADELVVRLFEQGIARADIAGIEAPQTVVEVKETELLRNDITIREIARKIGEEAETDPSGEIGTSARLRAGVAKRSVDELANVVIQSKPDGSKLFVGDVATIRIESVDRGQAFFVGEHPAVSIQVSRSERGDAIEVQKTVEETVDKFSELLPAGVSVDLTRTRSEAISARLNVLYSNGILGLGLVIVLLYLFLSFRVAFWVAAGIPVAMCAAISLMYAFGLSLNMVSLFGLIITLGIVVDDAIVVGEHADFRRRRLGESADQASTQAAITMSAPVFAATITTVIAFFGLTLIGGRFGSIITELAFAVVAILIASLLECFLILPHHMRHALKERHSTPWYDYPSRWVNKGFEFVRQRLFRPMVNLIVMFRYPIVAAAFVLLSIQVALFINGDVRWRFFSAPELGSVIGNFSMVSIADRSDSMEMMREMQRAAEAVGKAYESEFDLDPVTYVIAGVGGFTGRGLAGSETKDRDLFGTIAIELIDADLRPYSSFQFASRLQDEVRRHPLLETLSFRSGRFGPGGEPLEIQLSGAESGLLKTAADDLKNALSVYPEISSLEDDLAFGKEELVLELTPQGRALGFTIDGVGGVLRDRLAGVRAASFPDGTRTGEIRVRLPDQERETTEFLEKGSLRSSAGQYVPLSDIVTINRSLGFSTIRRDNGVRIVTVSGDVSEDDPERISEVSREMEETILPNLATKYGISWTAAGLSEDEREFINDAVFGLIMVLLGIYLVMAWVFSSWIRPLVVLLTIPFGLVGAIWGHYIWNVPFSMFSVIGVVGMVGIIVNDSIILITTIDKYALGQGKIEAVKNAVVDRFRPVLLTTLTTVVGLIPLLYETSSQASFLKPSVITLVYGLGFGMFLVLLLVPAMAAIQVDAAKLSRAFSAFYTRPSSRSCASLSDVIGQCVYGSLVCDHLGIHRLVWPNADLAGIFIHAGNSANLCIEFDGLLIWLDHCLNRYPAHRVRAIYKLGPTPGLMLSAIAIGKHDRTFGRNHGDFQSAALNTKCRCRSRMMKAGLKIYPAIRRN